MCFAGGFLGKRGRGRRRMLRSEDPGQGGLGTCRPRQAGDPERPWGGQWGRPGDGQLGWPAELTLVRGEYGSTAGLGG